MTDRPQGEDPGYWIGGLYDRVAAGLYRYALMILADPTAAADAVHQVFVAVLRTRNREIESGERYLRRAVRNECYSMLRHAKRHPAEAVVLEGLVAAGEGLDERIALQEAISSLPPEQREVVHLKIFEGMTFQEIADVVDESPNTIASRYRYAIEKLRSMLGAGS
jgi:RNA polymerase sigma-70 factor (ECF subfamily)